VKLLLDITGANGVCSKRGKLALKVRQLKRRVAKPIIHKLFRPFVFGGGAEL
jgi:hypothetical protein